MVNLFRNSLGHLLEPARIIEDDEDVIVHLVLGEEDWVGGVPFAHLLLIHVIPRLYKLAFDLISVLSPSRDSLNVAIIVILHLIKEEDVKLVIRL